MTDPNDAVALSQTILAINGAVSSLQRLGRSDKADEIIAGAERPAVYASIDADRDHSADYKISAYARAYINAMTTLARQLTSAASTAGTGDQDDAAKVYGVKGLAGDVASLAISRRDAGDRVEAITDPARLRELLATAVRNGDQVLAHAIAEVAIKSGDADTANDFSAAYPQLGPAVERLWNAEHRKMSTLDIKVAWRIAAIKPAALKALQDYEIAAAAAGDTNVGRWSVGA